MKAKTLIKFIAPPVYKVCKSLLSRIASLELAVDSLINSPKYVDCEDGGFNGQLFRKTIFDELLKAFDFDVIMETGTLIGNTTGYMAKTSGLAVYTCESIDLRHTVAKMRLDCIPDIHTSLSDSRAFLTKLASTDIRKKHVLIYLDAHWEDNLPLEDEIEIICNNWQRFVIMVDDFQVPGDEGYKYDDYGRHKSLSLRDFSDCFDRHDLIPCFPVLPSSEETGARKGCVVLARRGEASEKLNNLKTLSRRGL